MATFADAGNSIDGWLAEHRKKQLVLQMLDLWHVTKLKNSTFVYFGGLGLMMFVLIVSLPFYVMVMTSLKSQQSLMINPLDFSIDYSLGVKTTTLYIELFTDYDFMTLLINSTVVSLATVLITLLFFVPGPML